MSELNPSQKQEIQQWAEAEAERSKIRSIIHGFTDMCFRKCVHSASTPELTKPESDCMKNCVARFLDTNVAVVDQIAGRT